MPLSAESVLLRLRRRLVAQLLAMHLGAALLLAGGAWLLLAAAARVGAQVWWQPRILGGVLVGFVFLAALRAILRVPALTQVAALVDRRGQTRDRYVTSLAFAGAAKDPPRAAALRECAAYLAADRPERHFPWRVPREWRALPIVLVALGLLRWETLRWEREQREAAARAQAEVAPTVQALEELAKQVAARAETRHDQALRRLEEQIAKGAAELHRQVTDPAAAMPSALRELSALEQMAQSMQEQPTPISPEEMKALGEALAKPPATEDAAQKLKDGDAAAAAQALEEAARKLAEAGNQAGAEQAAATLREALDRLAEQQKLSQALDRLRQQMAQAGAEPSAALQKLAQMLRQMQPQSGSGSQPSAGASQELQRVLAALQNLKPGEAGAGKESPSAGGKDEGGRAMQIMPPNAAPGSDPQLALIPGASGLPGTEKDPDVASNPLGKTRQESAAKGADLTLRGQQSSQGQSFSQLLPGAPDASQAKRQYKELYDSLAPAAEDAVLQEEIPLGSRLFLKRYFEAIRPKE